VEQCVSATTSSSLSTSVERPLVYHKSSEMNFQLPEHWKQQLQNAPVGKRRVLQMYYDRLARINAQEPALMKLTDQELQAKTGKVFFVFLLDGER
jgi:hypothetical protein